MNKYKHKYRIWSTRLQNWDYGWNSAYFITICTYNRKNYFGNIYNGNMELSNIGVIADILWYEIKKHGKNIELGEFIVMPNHIHGILILNNYNDKELKFINDNDNNDDNNNVETRHALSLQPVTKHAHRLGYDFKWQSRFWEQIIRNEDEYNRIAQYIINNPIKWGNDKLNGENGNIVMEQSAEYNSEIWMM